ncbi:MAG: dihydrofolate reductase [Gemmatimonadetes bacterium]|nr:dihydrofolate reductase [Gemmatimonadota bacterium]
MRPVRYNVAATLDGYIAGPGGEFDWIPEDPAVDFAALFARVDTVLLGRRTYETVLRNGPTPWAEDARVYLFSRTLRPEDAPGATLVSEDAAGVVAALRAEPGDGEIWLFGGGELFRDLLAAGQVDTVEVTVVPVLLGAGVPLLPAGVPRTTLALTHSQVYPSGMVALHYSVRNTG